MNPMTIGIIAFACTFGGTLSGMWLHSAIPEQQLDADAKDTVRVAIRLIAIMTALVLGLITASAKSSFDRADAAVQQAAVDILALDRILDRYGPETREIRKGLRHVLGSRMVTLWPGSSSIGSTPESTPAGAGIGGERLADAISRLKPRDKPQRALQSRAQVLAEGLLKMRWLVYSGLETRSVPVLFLSVLLFWLTIIFASYGLFAPRNAMILAVLFLCALSIAGGLYLVIEMEAPFDGLLRVSSEPLRYAHAHLNQ